MNEKLLKQKAEEKFKTKPLGYEMKPELDIYTDGYIDGVTEETKLLSDENKELKILIASLVYEINQIWDINEMNDDLRKCAEKVEREVTLSKIADDNRMVISALGFAIVPPKLNADIKEV